MNNYEIKLIKNAYVKIRRKIKSTDNIAEVIGKTIHVHAYPLFNKIFIRKGIIIDLCVDKNTFTWNSFFRFVMIFVLTPTTSFFYCINTSIYLYT